MDAVLSVTPCDSSPIFTNTLRDDGTLRGFVDRQWLWSNRQELPVYYKLTGAVAISRWDAFRHSETFVTDTTLALPIDRIEAIDINEPVDFFIADALLRQGLTTVDALDEWSRKSSDP